MKQLPEGWIKVELNTISDIDKNSLSPTKTDPNYAITYISLSDVDKGKISKNLDSFLFKDAPSRARRIVNKDDILLSTVRPNLQGFAKINDDLNSHIASTGFAVLTAKPETNSDYLYQYLYSSHFKNQIELLVVGSSYPAINSSDVAKLKVLIPELYAEQEKIAEILSTWDQAIDSTEKLIANAKLQKKALMQQLLTGKKRLLDENGKRFSGKWEKVKLGDVATISKGVQRNRDTLTSTGDYPVINGGIEASGYTHEYNTEANTITISEGGNSCGYVSYQKGRFWCGGHCYFLTNISLNDLFLYQSLKLNELKIMNLRVGSGLPNIQKKAIDNFSFEYPIEIQEQQKIAEVLSTADREIELLTEKLEYLKAEKKALMQQLLTGKRRVKVA